ncbi:MAG TPA: TolC family protein [Vicinamibacteria bacterium]|nr:TolC family protein [Vicinamibacteria bacterium]
MISNVVLACALAGALAAPAVPVDDSHLSALVTEALSANPDLKAAEQLARAAGQRPAQVSARPDPWLGLGYTNEGWSPSLGRLTDTNLAVVAGQTLPWPGKLRLRGEIAAREADEVSQQVARARLSVAGSVRRAYYGLLEARAIAALTHEQADVWRQIEGVARARYAVGQGNQQDVLRTQVELTRVGQVLAEQAAEAAVRVAEINRLLARSIATPLETSAILAPAEPAAGLEAELARLVALSPERAAAAIALERARLAVLLAKKEGRPDFGVQAGYMNRGGLDPMWQGGVSVTLPLNRTRRASAVAEAEALVAAAQARLSAVELQLGLRTEERLAQLAAAREMAALYREGIVPQDRMSVEAAVASYETGRVPFVTVLEALTTLYGDRVTLVRLVAGQSRLRASLDEATLEPTSDLPSLTGATGMSTGPAGTASSAVMGSMSR